MRRWESSVLRVSGPWGQASGRLRVFPREGLIDADGQQRAPSFAGPREPVHGDSLGGPEPRGVCLPGPEALAEPLGLE